LHDFCNCELWLYLQKRCQSVALQIFFKDKINSLVCKKQKQIVFAELYPRFDSYFAKIALL